MGVDFLTHCRSRLLMVDCPWVVQMPDFQLETWLLKPGPNHNQALMWSLTKIDPNLKEYFQCIDEKDKPKEIVRMFACSGLVKSTESNKVLGNASRKELESFWDSVLNQLCLLQEFETAERSELCCDDALPLVSALTLNSDFWDLLEKKPDLLPADVMVPSLTVTLEDLKIQLADVEERLADTDDNSQSLGNGSIAVSGQSSLNSLTEASSLREKRIQKNLREVVALHKRSIDDSYSKFVQQLVMVIKKSPPNPIAKQLAQIVVDLHSKVKEFIEFLENSDEMKCLETSFSSRTGPEDCDTLKDSLIEFIYSMTQQMSLISNVINANKDILGL